jgi:hypothetical protein
MKTLNAGCRKKILQYHSIIPHKKKSAEWTEMGDKKREVMMKNAEIETRECCEVSLEPEASHISFIFFFLSLAHVGHKLNPTITHVHHGKCQLPRRFFSFHKFRIRFRDLCFGYLKLIL